MRRLLAAIVGTALWATSPQASNSLPEIGTVASSALTINQEIRYGEVYMRFIRASFPMTNDPVLSEYVTELGNRLVSNAEQVKTPFNFFLVSDPEINAAAFLGGYIKIHTGLFLYANSESEFASVIAHEIAHVTQRHIARYLENQANAQNLTYAGMIGSVLLAIANPIAGIAALQGTVAASMQSSINYTRANEFEADRIGLRTLANSGFDPQGMGSFFGKLSEKYRYASKPPQMLVTHPLPDTRVSEARARANQYPNRYIAPSLSYQLAKARIEVRHGVMDGEAALDYFNRQLERRSYALEDAAKYGKALALFEMGEFKQAKILIDELAKGQPDNLFYLDTQTDVDLALENFQPAIERLQAAQQRYPNNQVIVLNLAYAQSKADQPEQARKELDRYLRQHREDALAWSQLTRVERQLGNTARAHQANAEVLALRADYQRAVDELHSAFNLTEAPLERARIEARIEQFKLAEQELDELR
ncbi:M48 family metalloprotease [Aliagarivorans marinus]|uniref:beta-barrel assembly-enhancing protease n=1 Tax=Aliagarivorans marinus TaxID=561965 RepID=UPI000401836C|nr:M48 family metalloprotease [Aliagarivorans marinus]